MISGYENGKQVCMYAQKEKLLKSIFGTAFEQLCDEERIEITERSADVRNLIEACRRVNGQVCGDWDGDKELIEFAIDNFRCYCVNVGVKFGG